MRQKFEKYFILQDFRKHKRRFYPERELRFAKKYGIIV